MTLRRISQALFLTVLASTPVLAQPAAPARPAAPTPAPAPAAAATAMNDFDKEVDALFVAGGLTADQAARRAPGASPAVRKSAAQIDIAVAQAYQAELVRVPRVGASATYTRLSKIDPVVIGDPTNPGQAFRIESLPNSYVGQATVALALSDYLFTYPKLVAAARLGLQATKVTKRANELTSGDEARTAYYEWVRSRLQVMVAERSLTQVRSTLGQVRALAEAQRLSTADRMRVESQEAQAEQARDQLTYISQLREEQLRLLIGAPADEPLTIGEDIRTDVRAPGGGKLDELMDKARSQRLEFKALDLGILAKSEQRDSERANQLPKLSAFASADYARPNQRVFPQVDEFRFTWTAGVQLSWTLNDALLARANQARISAEERELRADRENLERGTRLAVLQAQQAVALAQQGLVTSQKGLAAAEEGYRVRQALLAAQRATAVELVDAETELTRSRITALDARVDLRVAIAQLEHALGNDAAKRADEPGGVPATK